MDKVLRCIVVFGILGFIANLVIACVAISIMNLLVVAGWVTMTDYSDRGPTRWYCSVAERVMRPYPGVTLGRCDTSPDWALEPPVVSAQALGRAQRVEVSWYATGFPYRSATGVGVWTPALSPDALGTRALLAFGDFMVPLAPIWRGVLLNTVFLRRRPLAHQSSSSRPSTRHASPTRPLSTLRL